MVDLKIKIPKGFLDEEERCGYVVSAKMKEIWAVELDLLAQLDRVCKANNIKYFGGAGTLIGAVRHGGFIPWDDDMDLYLLRDDYDRLMSLSNEFKEPYFLQNAYTDPALMRKHARLRNSRTCACSELEKDFPVNKGIFIDIFPIDGITEDKVKNKVQQIIDSYYRFCISEVHHIKQDTIKKTMLLVARNCLLKIRPKDKLRSFRRFENNLKKYSNENTLWWGSRTLFFRCIRGRRPLSDWQDLIVVPFEFTNIAIPRNYDVLLKQQYGDYMKYPKNKREGATHNILAFSTNYSYEDPRRLTEDSGF